MKCKWKFSISLLSPVSLVFYFLIIVVVVYDVILSYCHCSCALARRQDTHKHTLTQPHIRTQMLNWSGKWRYFSTEVKCTLTNGVTNGRKSHRPVLFGIRSLRTIIRSHRTITVFRTVYLTSLSSLSHLLLFTEFFYFHTIFLPFILDSFSWLFYVGFLKNFSFCRRCWRRLAVVWITIV